MMPDWISKTADPDATRRRLATAQLEKATKQFTAPLVMRQYDSGKEDERFGAEAEVLLACGYVFETQSEAGSHLHAGRLLLTGGLSIFAGRAGIRSKGKITVTFRRATP